MMGRTFRIVAGTLLVILIPLMPSGKQKPGQTGYISYYRQGEKWYNDANPTDEKDSMALEAFYRVIEILEGSHANDSVLWDSYYKAAIFEQTRGKYDQALPLLQKCIRLSKEIRAIPETAFYLPNLYLGNSFYFLNRYDSARFYFKMAEDIAMRHPSIEGLERLYNTLGVLNFETGNYRQSRNFFEKAVSVLTAKPKVDTALLVNFKSNLASSLRKLSDYDQAMKIYRSLLPYRINTDELKHNIAAVYLNIGASPQAIRYLHQVHTDNLNKYNDLALAYLNLEWYDSTDFYLRKADAANIQENGRRKNLYRGLTYRYRGDWYAEQGHPDSALPCYQNAIRQMIYSFNNPDVYTNPSSYIGIFSVIELYETLQAKAQAFRKVYEKNHRLRDLQAALDTYLSIYQLTDYTGKTYESDEARMFLNQKKHLTHQQPIETAIELYQQTGKEEYLEKAFFFDERNKASVLAVNLVEQELKQSLPIPDSLLSGEENLRENINRMVLKSSQINDSGMLQDLQNKISEDEIKLSAIQEKINSYPEYKRLKFMNNTVTIRELQESILPPDAAILSYHLGGQMLLGWLIRPGITKHFITPINDSFFIRIRMLNTSLQSLDQSNKRELAEYGRYFYRLLIKPFEKELRDASQLMVIPDDELNYVPFEMLEDENHEYLLREKAISYNYSCTLLKNYNPAEKHAYSLLAMAPYTLAGASGLPSLPASHSEIEGLQGKLLENSQATREAFLREAANASVLHLATHARANDEDPLQSFIAFYPVYPDSPSAYKLFLPEIYSLRLGKTSLTILSACETGSGQLVKGEGLISLSRAFSYAGCPNIITSLWIADDRATARIAHRVHFYLKKGYNNARSLQAAKNDYLDDENTEARLKTPSYWANLRLVGHFDGPVRAKFPAWWWFLIVPVLFAGRALIKKIRPAVQQGRNRVS